MPNRLLYPLAALILAIASGAHSADEPHAPAEAPAGLKQLAPPVPFRPLTQEDLEQTRAGLSRDLQQLSQFLVSLRSVGPGWRKYLRLADLKTQLQPGVAPDRNLLENIAKRFAQDQPGLEVAQLRAVGDALTDYLQLIEALSTENVEKQYDEQTTSMASWLQKHVASPSEEAASEVNRRLRWFARMHQAADLVRAVRMPYSQPNVFVSATQQVVGAGIEQAINDVTPLRDVILGTQITGSGHTVGRVEVDLVPDSKHATFDTVLVGTTLSNTVGRNGPATIWARGTTQISGRKRVTISDLGIRSFPATAKAATKTYITGIRAGRHDGGLIERIARKKIAQSKGQAEQIGSAHAEARIRNRLESEVAANLGRANDDFLKKFRNPLIRRHEFPSLFQLTTDQNLLHLTVREADATQLASSAAPPTLDEAAYDLAVRVHESAANNLAAIVLSGVTLHDEEVRQKVIELRGSLPEQFKDRDDQEPWSITFEKFRPVSLSIRDGGFEVVIRGQRYTTGEHEKNKYGAMYVRAAYKAEHRVQGFRWVRQGELDIQPPTAGRQGPKVIALKTILKKKFGRLFPENIEAEGFELPGRWQKAGKLGLAHLQADNGWIALAWRRSAAAPGAGTKVASAGR